MAIEQPPAIDALPTPPDPADRSTFNARAYPWSVAQGVLAAQIAAAIANVFNNASEALGSANSASASAQNATTSEYHASASEQSAATSAAAADAIRAAVQTLVDNYVLNGPVLSLNGQTGEVTVAGALGYTPLNAAGGRISGSLQIGDGTTHDEPQIIWELASGKKAYVDVVEGSDGSGSRFRVFDQAGNALLSLSLSDPGKAYFNGSRAMTLSMLSVFAQGLLGVADAAAFRTAISAQAELGYTPLNVAAVSAFIGTLLDDADAAAARSTLGAQAALGYTPANKAGDSFDGPISAPSINISNGAADGGEVNWISYGNHSICVDNNSGVWRGFRQSDGAEIFAFSIGSPGAVWFAGSAAITDANLLSHTASLSSAGGIGTYALLKPTDSIAYPLTFGGTYAGSYLQPASVDGSASGTVSGTWRCMGYDADSKSAVLFLRIA